MNNVRRELFAQAEKIRGMMEAEGLVAGRIVDSMPLFKFRCKMCRSDSVVVHMYEKAVCVGCLQCGIIELIADPETAHED